MKQPNQHSRELPDGHYDVEIVKFQNGIATFEVIGGAYDGHTFAAPLSGLVEHTSTKRRRCMNLDELVGDLSRELHKVHDDPKAELTGEDLDTVETVVESVINSARETIEEEDEDDDEDDKDTQG